MKSIVLTVLASMVFAGAAFADHANDENHEGTDGGGTTTVSTDVNVQNTNTNVNTNVANAEAFQGQEQGQFQAQGNKQSLTVEDAKNPASSSANLYLANCSSGASAQGFGGGGSIGGPDDVCLWLNVALTAQAMGQPQVASEALLRAVKLAEERTNPFIRFLQHFPILRRVI